MDGDVSAISVIETCPGTYSEEIAGGELEVSPRSVHPDPSGMVGDISLSILTFSLLILVPSMVIAFAGTFSMGAVVGNILDAFDS